VCTNFFALKYTNCLTEPQMYNKFYTQGRMPVRQHSGAGGTYPL
jgi:hypothetical protein